MKKYTALILPLLLLCFLAGCREESSKEPPATGTATEMRPTAGSHEFYPPDENFHESGGNLTMATLIDLVDRYGDNLTWDTFAPYWFEDLGSGVYDLRYPVDEDYELRLWGLRMEEPPEQIRLVSIHDPTVFIDIRTESIRDFIATGKAADATRAAKENAQTAALEHCRTSYDFIDVTYNIYRQRWYVEFWETGAKIAAQTVVIDKAGHLTNVLWAE